MKGIIQFQRMFRAHQARQFNTMMNEFILIEIQECKEVDARHTIRKFLNKFFNRDNIIKYKTYVLEKRGKLSINNSWLTDESIFEQREVHKVTSLIQCMNIVQ